MDALRSDPNDEKLAARLESFWRMAEARMIGLPVHNPALAVMVTPVRRFWSLPLRRGGDALVHERCRRARRRHQASAGWRSTLRLELPAGDVDFVVASMEDGDRYGAASLFSPMDEFGRSGGSGVRRLCCA